MSFRRNDIYIYIIFIFTIILGTFIGQGYISLLLTFFVYLYIGSLVEKKSNIHMMFFLGFSTFLFLPALLNWYYLDISFSLFFVSSFVAAFFLFLTKNTKVKEFYDYGGVVRLLFVLMSLITCVFIFTGQGDFTTSMFAFIILLLSLTFKQDKFLNNMFFLIIFIIVFTVYTLFYWSGFGRTVLFGWFLLAMLQFSYSINLKVNKYIFSLIPGLASTLLADRDILQLKFSGFKASLSDSAYGPYRLASSFIDHFNEHGLDVSGFWDQILFTFLVFIPRDFWPDKPYGFGFEYTIQNLDAYLIEAGHSIASTLIGDHIYFLGYFGVVTSLLVFSLIALATNALYRIKGLNGNGVLIFSSSMMVLVWGGMTSFSARIVLPSMVFITLFVLFKRFLTRRVRIFWGS